MDTISRENNSMLPVGGIIVGVLALLIAGYAAISLSKANNKLTELQTKIDSVEGAANNAASAATQAAQKADGVARDVKTLSTTTQDTVNTIGNMLTDHAARLTKIEEASKKAPVTGKSGKGGEVVAGPGEYVVKSGDTGMKIATANHVSVQDLIAVNPGVNWNSLKAGQKIKLPQKK